MKSKYLLSVLAVVLAVTLSAFKAHHEKAPNQLLTETIVWFEVDPSGDPLDDENGQPGINPFDCDMVQQTLCARALTHDSSNEGASEVTPNGDGTYSIKSGVDITSSAYYDGTLRKTTP